MSLAAVDDIDDAIDATKHYLVPFDRSTWLRMALVMFFITGGGGFLNIFANVFSNAAQTSDPQSFEPPAIGPETEALLIAAAVVFVLLVLLFTVVAPVMQFVFVEALIREEVHVRRYFRRNFWRGMQLFAFQIVLLIATVVVTVGLFAAALFGAIGGGSVGGNAGAAVGAVLIVLPIVLLFFLLFAIVGLFTSSFVLPIMYDQGVNILAAWARLWGSVRSNLKEYVAYLFFSFVLGIGVGIVASFAGLFAALLLGIPFGIVGGAVFFGLSGTVGTVLLGIVVVLYVLALFVASLLIQTPLQSFLQYYAMFVLGDATPDLDPVPDLRSAVRE